MSKAEPPRCDVCWMPVLSGVEGPVLSGVEGQKIVDVCARCRHSRPAFKAARAAFVYEGAARQAVHALKYGGVSALAGEMARSMAELLLQWNPAVSAIVPVPLAGGRRRLRGYNQSELLAREISRRTGLPLARRALIRRRSTPPQARQPDEETRRRNVAGAFQRGRPVATGVLLVDDVMTTGATLEACARVLRDSGAAPVVVLTFARED